MESSRTATSQSPPRSSAATNATRVPPLRTCRLARCACARSGAERCVEFRTLRRTGGCCKRGTALRRRHMPHAGDFPLDSSRRAEEQDAIGGEQRLVDVMRHEQKRRIANKFWEFVVEPIAGQRVESGERLVKEKKERIAGEKKVMRQILDESTNMQNDIKKESVLRLQKMGDLDDMLSQDTDITTKFLEKFSADATAEAEKFMDDLGQEITSRFDHQNKILDNMLHTLNLIHYFSIQ